MSSLLKPTGFSLKWYPYKTEEPKEYLIRRAKAERLSLAGMQDNANGAWLIAPISLQAQGEGENRQNRLSATGDMAPFPHDITVNWEAPMAVRHRGLHSEEYLEPWHPSG